MIMINLIKIIIILYENNKLIDENYKHKYENKPLRNNTPWDDKKLKNKSNENDDYDQLVRDYNEVVDDNNK